MPSPELLPTGGEAPRDPVALAEAAGTALVPKIITEVPGFTPPTKEGSSEPVPTTGVSSQAGLSAIKYRPRPNPEQ